jgi:hypothetical protein
MDPNEFKASLSQSTPPDGLGLSLLALWHDAKGDWNRAHELAQQDASQQGARVHAYLHRKEGDVDNAAYWYARSTNTSACRLPLDEEWEEIVTELLAR